MTGDLSIVVAVRDGAEWLGDALESARDADGLREIIVVDDGSRDASAAVAQAAAGPVRVLRQPPRGAAAAHNEGVRAARGSVIAFLDSDDRWVAQHPDPRRAVLANADAVWGRLQCIAAGRPFREPFHLGGINGMLARREAFDVVGPFDETMLLSPDLDWMIRAGECGLRIGRVDAVVYHYYLRHGSNTDGPGRRQGLLAAVTKAVQRRRPAAAP